MRWLTAILWAVCVGSFAAREAPVTASVQENSQPEELTLSYVGTESLLAPDGAHTLYGVPFQEDNGMQLWIKNNSTGARKWLLNVGSSIQARWSPDGKSFSVNDQLGSDLERAYIYDVSTLHRLNVGKAILAADPESKPFTSGHAYFQVERWDGSEHVFARFQGHTDEPPVQCFDFRYRISRAGLVEKLSQRVALIDENYCDSENDHLKEGRNSDVVNNIC